MRHNNNKTDNKMEEVKAAAKVTKQPKQVLKGSTGNGIEFLPNGTVKMTNKNGNTITIPKHIYNLAAIVNNNYDVRRFTALNILKELEEIGDIEPIATNRYVDFSWNKFTVSADGIRKQYSYREDFFIKSLSKAFEDFAKQAENNISVFIDIEDKLYNEKLAKLQAKHGSIVDKVKPVDDKPTEESAN